MKKKAITLLSLVSLLAVLLTACGAASDQYEVPPPVALEAPVEKMLEREAVGGGYVAESSDITSDANPVDLATERMIIWNANISLTVEDVAASMDAVQSLARELGGYPVNISSWMEGEQLYATVTIRVPAERFDETMTRLREMGIRVNRENANSEDVTDQYVDLESRLRHLEAKEAQLLEFMEDAEDTEAVLAVYEHLDETQAEIEQVKGQMKYLSTLAAMGTITVELYPEEAEPPVVDEDGWNPGRTLRDALRALLKVLEALGNLAIWIAVFTLPLLLLVVLPLILIVAVLRRRSRKAQQPPAVEQKE